MDILGKIMRYSEELFRKIMEYHYNKRWSDILIVHNAPNLGDPASSEEKKHESAPKMESIMRLVFIGGIILGLVVIFANRHNPTAIILAYSVTLVAAITSYYNWQIVQLGQLKEKDVKIIETLVLFVSFLGAFGVYVLTSFIAPPRVGVYTAATLALIAGVLFYKILQKVGTLHELIRTTSSSTLVLTVSAIFVSASHSPYVLSFGSYGIGLGVATYYFLNLHPWIKRGEHIKYVTLGVGYSRGREFVIARRKHPLVRRIWSFKSKLGRQIFMIALESPRTVVQRKGNKVHIRYYKHRFQCPPTVPDIWISDEGISITIAFSCCDKQKMLTLEFPKESSFNDLAKTTWSKLAEFLWEAGVLSSGPYLIIDGLFTPTGVDGSVVVKLNGGLKGESFKAGVTVNGKKITLIAEDKLTSIILRKYIVPIEALMKA